MAIAAGAAPEGTLTVVIDHSGGMTEFVDWPIERAFAVTDLQQGHPGSVAIYRFRGDISEVRVHGGYKKTVVYIIAKTAEAANEVLSIGDRYFPAYQPEQSESSPLPLQMPSPRRLEEPGRRGPLAWLEGHSAYRWLVVIISIAAGGTLLVAVARWIAHAAGH